MLGGVLVVTGGASGIGLACAKAMASAHDRVALIDVNEDGFATAAAQIDEVGGAASTWAAHAVRSAECGGAVPATVDGFGGGLDRGKV